MFVVTSVENGQLRLWGVFRGWVKETERVSHSQDIRWKLRRPGRNDLESLALVLEGRAEKHLLGTRTILRRQRPVGLGGKRILRRNTSRALASQSRSRPV